MPSYGQVAAQVAKNKQANPQAYCPAPRCLWRVASGVCPKHGEQLELVITETGDLVEREAH